MFILFEASWLTALLAGNLLDASTFKITDDSNKNVERYVLLFAYALVGN